MPEPLDLAAIRARNQYDSSGAALDISRCLAVIEALREALASILSVKRTIGDDGLTTAEWHLACGNGRAALALVTGGRDA